MNTVASAASTKPKKWQPMSERAGDEPRLKRILDLIEAMPPEVEHTFVQCADLRALVAALRAASRGPEAPPREAAWIEALEYGNKMAIQSGGKPCHIEIALEHLRARASERPGEPNG